VAAGRKKVLVRATGEAINPNSRSPRHLVTGMENQEPKDTGIILRVALFSLLVNACLVAIKLAVSFFTGSLSIRADAVHSFIDIIGSAAVILGLIISGRKSKGFPYGLYKVENLVAIIIALLLFGTAYEVIHQAIFSPSEIHEFGVWVLAVTAALVFVPFLFGRYEVGAGKKFNSPSLIADGKNFRADVLSSAIVFFGLLGQFLQYPLDRIAAVLVAVFIMWAGWGILVDGMKVLLDASIDRENLDLIRAIIEDDPAVVEVKKVMGRNSGRFVFVEVEITLRTTSLERAHQISERIEREIAKKVPNVDHTVLHYEPRHAAMLRYGIPLADAAGSISTHFGEAPYFAVVDMERSEVVANPHRQVLKGKGITVAKYLVTFKPDVIATREDIAGKGPGYVFADAGVITVRTDAEDLDTFLRTLINDLPEPPGPHGSRHESGDS
jgi:cation diffusion facilitator family transporter